MSYNCEYLDGDINGEGRTYDVTGNLIFIGEFLNGIKNGKAKEFAKNGEKLLFDVNLKMTIFGVESRKDIIMTIGLILTGYI